MRRYLPQSQHQLYHQQFHQEQPHRRPSSSGDALMAHTHTLTSAPLDSTVMFPPYNPNIDANSSTKPSLIPPPGLVFRVGGEKGVRGDGAGWH